MLPMLPQDIPCEIIDALAAQNKKLDIIRLRTLDSLPYHLAGEAKECSDDSYLVERDASQWFRGPW